MMASTMVTAILPVTLAPPGNTTMSPSRFMKNMKKNTVSTEGAKRADFCFRVGFITPS